MCRRFIFILLLFSGPVLANTVQTELQHLIQSRSMLEQAPLKNHILNETNRPTVQRRASASLKGYQFVLFYRSSCPHCQRFDPILKAYSVQRGIRVKAFTTNGRSLPSFPQSIPLTRHVLNEFFGNGAQLAVPTLFIMNTQSLHVYPVSVGELTYAELDQRLRALLPKIRRYEENHHD